MRSTGTNQLLWICPVVLLIAACTATRGAAPPPTRTTTSQQSAQSSSHAASIATSPSIDPATSQRLPSGVIASIQLDENSGPEGIVTGFGSVWVAAHQGYSLYRISPRSNKVVAKINLPGTACGAPVVGARRVWVQPCASGGVMVVNPSTDKVTKMVPDVGTATLALTPGSFWTANTFTSALVRLSTSTYKPQRTFTGDTVGSLATLDGLVWTTPQVFSGSGSWKGALKGIDPRTDAVVKRIKVPNPGHDVFMIAAFGRLWLKSSDTDVLVRVDPQSGSVTTYHLKPFAPSAGYYDPSLAAGLSSLWVRTGGARISRIDPATGKVLGTYPADAAGAGGEVTVGFRSLWVVNYDSDTVWRFRASH